MVTRLNAACRIAALAAMVFSLAGCLSVKTGLDVHPDDTVSGQLIVYAPVSELATNGRTKEAGFAAYRKSVPPLPKGTEVPYDDGTNYGVQITYTDTPLSEFSGNLKITHTGNRFVFTVGLDPKVLAANMDGDVNSAGILVKATSLEISVSLPGSIVKDQTNGTVVGQNTVTWNIAANVDKPTQLLATSEVGPSASPTASGGGGSGTPWLLVIGIVVILVLVVAVVVLLLLLRRRASSPPPAA